MNRLYLPLLLLFTSFASLAQKGHRVFQDDIVHELHVNFYGDYDTTNGTRWADTLFHYHQQHYWGYEDKRFYLPASITFDTITKDSVGIRMKGVASIFKMGEKYPFKLKFDKYNKGRDLDGLEKINIANEYGDQSMIHNKLVYDLCSWMGIPSPRTSFCKVFVNGEYRGLYTLVEQIDDKFLGMHYPKDGHLYKAFFATWDSLSDNWSGTDWITTILEPENFKKDHDYSDVMQVYDAVELYNSPALGDVLDQYFDLNHYVKHFAAEIMTVSNDNFFIGAGANIHYFYDSASATFKTIPWDMSLSFEESFYTQPSKSHWLSRTISIDSSFHDQWGNQHEPFRHKINKNGILYHDGNRALLLDNLCHIANEYYASGYFASEISKHQSLIRDAVYTDPYKKYTNSDFDASAANFQQLTDSINKIIREDIANYGHTCSSFHSITDIIPDFEEIYIDVDEVVFYNIRSNPQNATYPSYKWAIDNKDIASTKFYGRIKGKSPGTTILTISSADGSVHKQITIHVNDIITAANEAANPSNFDVYPNPSNGILNIQTKDESTPSKIELHDIDGRLMHTFHDPDRIDLNEFHPGIYFLVGTNDNIPFKVKIVLL